MANKGIAIVATPCTYTLHTLFIYYSMQCCGRRAGSHHMVTQACKILMWTLSGCQLHSSFSFAFVFFSSTSACARVLLSFFLLLLFAVQLFSLCAHSASTLTTYTDEQINHIFFAQQHDNLFYVRVICGRSSYPCVRVRCSCAVSCVRACLCGGSAQGSQRRYAVHLHIFTLAWKARKCINVLDTRYRYSN